MSPTGGDDLLGLVRMLSWAQTGFHVAIATAFVIFCFVRARRIGVAGASLLAVVGLVDVVSLVVYRLGMSVVTASQASTSTVEATLNALGVLDVMFTLVSIGLTAAGFNLLRSPPTTAFGDGPS